ncbi:F-box/kelch-repeat protein At3g61590-like [Daucus carota subsp. sativus]|uniref:F-box/kelch-repeat protein At3g61590-like n=1 Tax=Daucus carota subsp. sativus TaxID=79200 RepID=UPI0007EF386F|nr:PREDICTED: F-box/kelch-repeat protein At3g61590-like [Daucus carota subsp. sativus]
MYHGYRLMGYPIYSNSGWDDYHYAFRLDQDPRNVFLAGGAPWPYHYDFAPSRIGTGVFIPRLDQGTGVFHPNLELLGTPNRAEREQNVVIPDRVNRERNLVNPSTVDRRSSLVSPNGNDRESNLFCIDSLPDELQELVLSFLPLPCIIGSSCVSKKWKQIIHSGKFKMKCAEILSKKPWYFMFTNSDEPTASIYNPLQRHWSDFEFPFKIKHSGKIAASCGLICMIEETDCNSEIYICNPMTRRCRKFEEQFGVQESTYSSLAFSVDKPSSEYTIAIVRSWQVHDTISYWYTSIHIYNSGSMTWLPPMCETLSGWRAGNDSIVFDGVLHFVVTKNGMPNTHALLSYNINSSSPDCNLMTTLNPIPFSLTCVRLMNVQDKIVMVGGLGSHDVPEKIGIWMLKGTEWEEVSWVPDTFFKGFGEVDDVFASSGTGDLIYIQAYGSPSLLVFDMKSKAWKWCQKKPQYKKRYALQLFSGFCFEPRLDISP